MKKNKGPKVLIVDIETAPILGYVWDIWDQNIALNQIKSDWHILSWSAKWLGDKKIMYMDQRHKKNIEDDKTIVKGIWNLLDEADIVIGQNSKKFDIKKLNTRFVLHGLQPPSSFKQIDTLVLAKKYFAFTSNKLEYMSDKLCKKYKKLKHKEFPGFELWKECLARNVKAWDEMKRYNIHDVLSTEELYNVFKSWDNTINFNLYTDSLETVCKCGSKDFSKNGFAYTSIGKFQRYKCDECGSETRDRKNLLDKDKKASIKSGTVR